MHYRHKNQSKINGPTYVVFINIGSVKSFCNYLNRPYRDGHLIIQQTDNYSKKIENCLKKIVAFFFISVIIL